eukprot:gnl/MRDRNA2_/MRDRNA2_18384_c0_seq1.p1 gnl/MRDRNA2_/MRDRNA2_18384_c0~~gnl/MRDRNA2_/MRDRNA2_18384_c0_seq1.p1  ORF type:complete len:481 (+),score=95.29 gnl/MRDRNA2_/MRDRNA2_18384_c0_seq1:124-1443(+)
MFATDAQVAGLPLAESAFNEDCRVDQENVERIAEPWSQSHLQSILEDNGINGDEWSPKTYEHLLDELTTGYAMLVMEGQDQDICCLIEVVLVVIVDGKTGDVLVMEAANEYRDDMPSIVKNVNQSIRDAAEKCIQEKVSTLSGCVDLHLHVVKTVEQQEFSDFYPGLVTIVRKHIVQGSIAGEGSSTQSKGKSQGNAWQWKSLSKVTSLSKHHAWLKKSHPILSRYYCSQRHSDKKKERTQSGGGVPFRRQSTQSVYHSPNRAVVLPWTPEEISKVLEAHHVSPTSLGKSLEDLSKEFSSGLLYFARFKKEKRLFLTHDVVCLRIVSTHSKAVLVQSLEEENQMKSQVQSGPLQWPQEPRLHHESIWETARNVVRKQLMLEDDPLNLLFESREFPLTVETLQSHDNCIIERQWLVTAHLPEGAEDLVAKLNPPIPVQTP